MTLPFDWQQRIEEGQRLRGWLVNSFAQVEYLLGDLILRCRAFAEFDEHTRTLPHGAPDRIARIRAIIAHAGPLAPDADAIRQVIDQLSAQQDTRNLLVHGFCTVLHTPDGEIGFHFQKFHRQPDRRDARLIRTFTLEGLQRERDEQTAFAKSAVACFQAMHQRLRWEGPMADDFHGDGPFSDGNQTEGSSG